MRLRSFGAIGLSCLGILTILASACSDQTVDTPVFPDGGRASGTGTGSDASLGDGGGGSQSDSGGGGNKDGGGGPMGTDGGDGGSPPAEELTRCKTTASGSGGGVMLVGTVLTPDSATGLDNGEVLVDTNGLIACVGAAGTCDAMASTAKASTVTCTNAVISPGLINAHDHISYANDAPQPNPTNIRYNHRNEWRKGTDGFTKNEPSGGASYAVLSYGELRFFMGGVTSIVGSGGEVGLTRNLDNSDSALYEGLNIQQVDFDVFPLNDSGGTSYPSGCGSYSSGRETTAEMAKDDAYLPHIAEGIDLEAHNEVTCQSIAPNDLIQKQTAIIHSVAVSASDAANYRARETSVIWSPRSNISLYGNTAPVTMLDDLGVPITLGTDWLPSGSMNMQRELACADSLNTSYFAGHFTDKALWEMVTTNAAYATGVASVTGMLKVGLAADIAIYDASVHPSHRAVIASSAEDVILVMRGGKAIYGDQLLMSDPAFGQGDCEALDVCNAARLACVSKDTGGEHTLAEITAAGQAIYPLFTCASAAPPTEPSCTPWRTWYPNGIATGDQDGDGVPDATDNCPTIFNAVRLMDSNDMTPTASSAQPDTDGDGQGDACDPCPLQKGGTCTVPNPDDRDGDGVVNTSDNCPEVANPSQSDSDGDGYGDACEFSVSISAVRDPSSAAHPAVPSIVEISGAYVTAVRNGTAIGFYLQDPSATEFGGIFVSTGATVPSVAVGNVVNVTGEYVEQSSVSTLLLRGLTVTDSGTTHVIAPLKIASPATLANATTFEPYESMLVEVDSVVVTNENPDAPKDFDELEVGATPDAGAAASLRIDDELYPPLDNTYVVGTTFTRIAGIAGVTFGEEKMWPRSTSDFTTP